MNKLLLLFFVSINTIFSQYSLEFEKYRKQFPEAHVVRINESTTIDIELISGEIVIDEHIDYENILLSNTSNFATKNQVSYSSFSEISDLKASSYNFNAVSYTHLTLPTIYSV